MLPPDEARKVLVWAQQLADLRLFPVTLVQRDLRLIGRLPESDWTSVRACFKAGFGID
jgi:hypothetical protein